MDGTCVVVDIVLLPVRKRGEKVRGRRVRASAVRVPSSACWRAQNWGLHSLLDEDSALPLHGAEPRGDVFRP